MITLDAVRAMTDAEFAEANRRRAWRETLGTLPAAETAPGEARLVEQRNSHAGSTPPLVKHARDMTDAEFSAANAAKAWRQVPR